MQFVAAGFDFSLFWRLTPRSFAVMMRGAREATRARRLQMAEAVRAGSMSDGDDFAKWVAAVSGQDGRLPPEMLQGALRRGEQSMEIISMGDALKRMH